MQVKRSSLMPIVGFSVISAKLALQEAGLEPTERPAHEPPVMPDDMSDISFKEVGYLFGSFTAWASYMSSVVALAETRATETKVIKERTYAIVRLGKAGTVQDKDAKTLTDDTYAAVENRYLQDAAKAKLLKAKMDEFKENAAALSREQSRREAEIRAGERR